MGKFEEIMEKRKEKIIERISNNPNPIKRNSFLEPVNVKDFTNPAIEIPYGIPKTTGGRRCVLGASRNKSKEI